MCDSLSDNYSSVTVLSARTKNESHKLYVGNSYPALFDDSCIKAGSESFRSIAFVLDVF